MTESVLTLLDLDGTYLKQHTLQKQHTPHLIDLSDIKGKNLYCEDQAFSQMTERLSMHIKTPITLIGSGNYHYVSYYYLSQLLEPFTLILLDHHSDMLEQEQWLTCGSWVARALRTLSLLDQVIMIGVNPKTLSNIPPDLLSRIHVLPKAEDLHESFNTLSSIIPTDSIYISVDKDVFSEQIVKTNWDQGTMTFKDLDLLFQTLSQYHLSGIDICGEWPVHPEDQLLPRNQIITQKNEKANLIIIEKTKQYFLNTFKQQVKTNPIVS